jgi:hypothetical protein
MSSRASETVLWIVVLLVSPLFRGATVRVGSLGEIFATHFPVNMLLMLIDPMGETEKFNQLFLWLRKCYQEMTMLTKF